MFLHSSTNYVSLQYLVTLVALSLTGSVVNFLCLEEQADIPHIRIELHVILHSWGLYRTQIMDQQYGKHIVISMVFFFGGGALLNENIATDTDFVIISFGFSSAVRY
jgi:hypothetical protein